METPYLWAFHNIRLCAELNINDYIVSIIAKWIQLDPLCIIDGTSLTKNETINCYFRTYLPDLLF